MSSKGQLISLPFKGILLSPCFWRKLRTTAARGEDERLVLEAILAEDKQLHVASQHQLHVASRLSGSLPIPAMIWWRQWNAPAAILYSSSQSFFRLAGRAALAFGDIESLRIAKAWSELLEDAEEEAGRYSDTSPLSDTSDLYMESPVDLDVSSNEPEEEDTGVPFEDLYRSFTNNDVIDQSDDDWNVSLRPLKLDGKSYQQSPGAQSPALAAEGAGAFPSAPLISFACVCFSCANLLGLSG